ncbi:MAG TPA: CehA/McbA family metallohydrolase [Pirellulales bacterium]|nr:CehA/McbA family metallohydrolase [Pirellulales bacterium]
MNRLSRVLTAALVCLAAATPVRGYPPAGGASVDPSAEGRIHTPEGFRHEGKPQVYASDDAARLRVRVVDHATQRPTFCRVNVVGADGNYYEPRENPLANWSLFRAGNRLTKGPFRYYGWFFYSTGEFEVTVPPGATRLELWKGFEFEPVTETVQALPQRSTDVKMELTRVAPLAGEGYHSGDTHIHLPRVTADDDQRALDLIAAEDLEYGYILSANDGGSYVGDWRDQRMAPQRVQGRQAIVERGGYTIAAGQEYVTRSYGHLGTVLQSATLLAGQTVDPNRWPPLGVMGLEARTLGGYSINLHGGNGGEVYIDFAQQATDGVELLQFAEYRGIGLEGWYHMLGAGFRFAAFGASDYPVCRVLGDCRTYAHTSGEHDPVAWARAAAEGRSFITTGPLLLLEVDGHRPGDTIDRPANARERLQAKVRVRSPAAAIDYVELIANGKSVERRRIAPREAKDWFTLEAAIDAAEPVWIAAKAGSTTRAGLPDSEAHTNPVFVTIDGGMPCRDADLRWLRDRVDEQITAVEQRTFDEQAKVLEFFRASRQALDAPPRGR